MKDRDCINCVHIFDCKGKPSDKPCLNYEPRKEKSDGRKKNVCKDNN